MTAVLVQHIKKPCLATDNTLHVIGVISNSARYQSRIRLARQWEAEMCATPNVALHMVEAAFGDRHHELAADLKVRTTQSIWIKENLINLGVRHLLPTNWKYVAWIDCDITFRDPNWAQETLHQLQHHQIVQPWSQCSDIGPFGEVMQLHQSFGYLHQQGVKKLPTWAQGYAYAHTGYAWAATRSFWERVGGLPDFCLLGSADHHSAWAAIGQVEKTIPNKMAASYHRRLKEYQARALPACDGDVGYVPGRIEHHWHGPKTKRFYKSRWEILIDTKYDPDTDTYHDAQGVIHTTNKALDRAVHKYNVSRDEDSVSGE